MTFNRRDFLRATAAAGVTTALTGCKGAKSVGHVVVIGGGFGGATLAKYLRLWSDGGIDVTLIERNTQFLSCPMSNLVLAGEKTLDFITLSYDGLKQRGVRVVRGEVTAIDPERRTVRLASGDSIAYDRLAVAPGIDFMFDRVPGHSAELGNSKIFHAWQAGPQTLGLRKQLEDMPDGGVFAMTVPKTPFRCPPGPYERACLVAHYLKTQKPRSKLLILDANDDVVTKKGLFTAVWKDLYDGIVEYRPKHEITRLDAAEMTLKFEFADTIKADVINLIPPQKAGEVARQPGLITAGNRWCNVDWRSLQSTVHPTIHVLGDATLAAPGMPKSGHTANQHAKIAAAAIVNLMSGMPVTDPPPIANACYSFVSDKLAVHVTAVMAYNADKKFFEIAKDSAGVSSARNEMEARYAIGWARNIWADTLL